jgi:deoxyadenosine/deoxycytidine kinase
VKSSLSIEEIVDKPVSVHLVAEMGAGKSTFLALLLNYQKWLTEKHGLQGEIFHAFAEDVPHHIWDEYQRVKKDNEPSPVVYEAQRWFMNQKLDFVKKAAGIGYEREPGFYIVERDPREDYYVFAGGLSSLFMPGEYERYQQEFRQLVDSAPSPNLVVRLKVSPEVSIHRVKSRQSGELLSLGDYYRMAGDYMIHVDRWIEKSRIPKIELNTGLEMFDFDTDNGQAYFLTSFLHGLNKNGYWNLGCHLLPMDMLININGAKY